VSVVLGLAGSACFLLFEGLIILFFSGISEVFGYPLLAAPPFALTFWGLSSCSVGAVYCNFFPFFEGAAFGCL